MALPILLLSLWWFNFGTSSLITRMDGELKKSQSQKGSSSSLVADKPFLSPFLKKNNVKVKSLSEQDKDRKKSIDEIDEFFAQAIHYFEA